MTDWHCPNCLGGFPDPERLGECPWCGQGINGSYECESPGVVSRTVQSESESDSGGFLGLFK